MLNFICNSYWLYDKNHAKTSYNQLAFELYYFILRTTMNKFLIVNILLALFVCFSFTGCPLVRGTGNAVQATGEGVAHAVEGTGDAIGQTGRELAN